MNDVDLGARLRQARRERKLTLADVESRSGREFKASVLGAYERGDREISVARLGRLTAIYDLTLRQFLGDDDSPDGAAAAGASRRTGTETASRRSTSPRWSGSKPATRCPRSSSGSRTGSATVTATHHTRSRWTTRKFARWRAPSGAPCRDRGACSSTLNTVVPARCIRKARYPSSARAASGPAWVAYGQPALNQSNVDRKGLPATASARRPGTARGVASSRRASDARRPASAPCAAAAARRRRCPRGPRCNRAGSCGPRTRGSPVPGDHAAVDRVRR